MHIKPLSCLTSTPPSSPLPAASENPRFFVAAPAGALTTFSSALSPHQSQTPVSLEPPYAPDIQSRLYPHAHPLFSFYGLSPTARFLPVSPLPDPYPAA